MEKFSEYQKANRDGEGENESSYQSINDLWEKELNPQKEGDTIQREGSRDKWYEKQKKYWDGQPTTIDGVLGGYGKHHFLEMDYSVRVFTQFTDQLPSRKRAIEIGGGIGRVSKVLLNTVFEEIDLNDQSEVQIEEAKKNVPFVKNFYLCGYQDMKFEHKYDCIWLQWFLMYLTDDDLIASLKRSADALTVFPEDSHSPGQSGLIIIKENVKNRDFIVDKEDNCVIRSAVYFQRIFEAAGLEVLHSSF